MTKKVWPTISLFLESQWRGWPAFKCVDDKLGPRLSDRRSQRFAATSPEGYEISFGYT